MSTVLAHGVWDLLHPGHIAHLQAARSFGDRLVVSITADQYVNKGPGRPVFTADDRADMLRNLRIVDDTFICEALDAIPAIEHFKPQVYVKGKDYLTEDIAGNLVAEREVVAKYGGEIRFTDTPLMSSSRIINRAMPTVPQGALDWLLGSGIVWADIQAWFDRAATLTPMVAGETIRDVYEYVTPAGKSPKEPVITWLPDPTFGEEEWAGGATVIANHVRAICPNVAVQFPRFPIIKRRQVHHPFTTKVFSKADVPDIAQCGDIDHDGPVICADFGHGYFSPPPRIENWLALTVQANSLNWGLNRATKWEGAEYIVLDSAEVQLAMDERGLTDIEAARKLSQRMDRGKGCTVVVTRGHEGAILVTRDAEYACPAFTDRAVDRIGAGDAFLSFSAPLAYLGAPPEVLLLVGSCAAALHVQTPGNAALKREAVLGFLKSTLA